ncbi:unnamed protein product, partial [Symbiodinium sp. CCMP2456]
MKCFAEYIKHYTELDYPMKLTKEQAESRALHSESVCACHPVVLLCQLPHACATQATNRWHYEKTHRTVAQDEVRMPDANGLPNGPKVVRLAVIIQTYVDNQSYAKQAYINQSGNRRDRPTSVQVQDLDDAYQAASTTSLFEDDDAFDNIRPPVQNDPSAASMLKGQASTSTSQARTGKLGGSTEKGLSDTTAKKPARIKNISATSLVTIAKNKVATMDKYQDCLDMPVKFQREVQEVRDALVIDGGHCSDEGDIGPSNLDLNPEVLVANAVQMLKLRTVICEMCFGIRKEWPDADGTTAVTADKIMHLVRRDPFLGPAPEFKDADALISVADIGKERNEWSDK